MPGDKFQNDNYYHIYNRGVDKRVIFNDKFDYLRFLQSIKEFNQTKPTGSLFMQKRRPTSSEDVGRLVEIIAYCLNPNHYHLLIKQITDGGISEYIKRLSGGYTKYFNNRNKRSGSLFQGKYKATEIKSDIRLLYLSAYINGNSEIHNIAKADKWPWSSYAQYLNCGKGVRHPIGCRTPKTQNDFAVDKTIILSQFKNVDDYKNYLLEVIVDTKQQKKEMKEFLLED